MTSFTIIKKGEWNRHSHLGSFVCYPWRVIPLMGRLSAGAAVHDFAGRGVRQGMTMLWMRGHLYEDIAAAIRN